MRNLLPMLTAGALALVTAAVVHAEPPEAGEIDNYPLATAGHYSSANDYAWVFFRTPDGWSCGIGPNGGPIGCDAVPADAPANTNQTVVTVSGVPAVYRHVDSASFSRTVDVLPDGYRLENWGSACAVHQGAVTCKSYGYHGFTISSARGSLW